MVSLVVRKPGREVVDRDACSTSDAQSCSCSVFSTRQIYVKPEFTAAQLANYKIPAWADPHYSASGNDRNFG